MERQSQCPSVDIVIVAWNEESTIGSLFDSLKAQVYPLDALSVTCVVRERSTDRTEEISVSNGARILPGYGCLGADRNRGIRSGNAEFVILLDADCVPEPHWLDALVGAIESQKEMAACSGAFENIVSNAKAIPFARHFLSAPAEQLVARTVGGLRSPLPWVMTGNVIFRRSALEQAGYFDEHMDWSEDVDLSWRLVQLGYQLGHCPDARVRHYDESTIKGFARKSFRYGQGAAMLASKYGLKAPELFPTRSEAPSVMAEAIKGMLHSSYLAGFATRSVVQKLAGTTLRMTERLEVLAKFRQPWFWRNGEFLRLSPDMVFWCIDDQTMCAVHIPRHKRYTFEDSAFLIFKMLTNGLSRAEVMESMGTYYEMPPAHFAADVDEFVERLTREALAEILPGTSDGDSAPRLVQALAGETR